MEDHEQFQAGPQWALHYRTGESGSVIEVAVYYSLGGVNYWRGTPDPRGVWASVTPKSIEEMDTGHTIERITFVLGDNKTSGLRFFVMARSRKNDKKLEQVAEKLDLAAPEVAALWVTDHAAAIRRMKEAIDGITGKVAA